MIDQKSKNNDEIALLKSLKTAVEMAHRKEIDDSRYDYKREQGINFMTSTVIDLINDMINYRD